MWFVWAILDDDGAAAAAAGKQGMCLGLPVCCISCLEVLVQCDTRPCMPMSVAAYEQTSHGHVSGVLVF